MKTAEGGTEVTSGNVSFAKTMLLCFAIACTGGAFFFVPPFTRSWYAIIFCGLGATLFQQRLENKPRLTRQDWLPCAIFILGIGVLIADLVIRRTKG